MAQDIPHAPLLKKARRRNSSQLRADVPIFFTVGLIIAVLLAILPVWDPNFGQFSRRAAFLMSQYLILVALFAWFGGKGHSYFWALILLGLLYAASSAGLFFGADDLGLIVLLSSLFLFVIAGIQTLLIIEEVVYDTHRMLRNHRIPGLLIPFGVIVLGVASLPLLRKLGLDFGATLALLPFAGALLIIGLVLSLFQRARFAHFQLETHYVVSGLIAGGLVADLLRLLPKTGSVLPSVIAYLILLVTWAIVGYSTLHRARIILGRGHPKSWVAILHASLFGLIAHAHQEFSAQGAAGVTQLAQVRTTYLLIGVWIGFGFFVIRSIVRILRILMVEVVTNPNDRRRLELVANALEVGVNSPEHAARLARDKVRKRRRSDRFR